MIYDFGVVGGGIAGVSAAYELAEHGSVLLLETENVMGYHATGRSAALFTRNFGGPVVRRINDASAGFFAQPPSGFCDSPLLSARGCLTVASAGFEEELKPLLAMSQAGEIVCRIDPKEALERVPFLRPERVQGAVFEANVSDIDVASLHQGYIKGARMRGAEMLVKQGVLRISRDAGAWLIETANNSFRALQIINAAGAWADEIGALVGARSVGLVPKRRTGILIKAPNEIVCAKLPAIDFAGTDAYMKPDAGRLMVSPGDATPSGPMDAWADDMDIAVLADWIESETLIKVPKIEHSWAGLRSFVPDEAPVVGFDHGVPNFFWLAGQGGYGIMMAPVLAKLTADLCTKANSEISTEFAVALSPARFNSFAK